MCVGGGGGDGERMGAETAEGVNVLACVFCVSRPLCGLGLKFKVSMCVRECMFVCMAD